MPQVEQETHLVEEEEIILLLNNYILYKKESFSLSFFNIYTTDI